MFTSDSKMFNHRKFGWEDRKLIKKKKKTHNTTTRNNHYHFGIHSFSNFPMKIQ